MPPEQILLVLFRVHRQTPAFRRSLVFLTLGFRAWCWNANMTYDDSELVGRDSAAIQSQIRIGGYSRFC